MIGSGGLHLAAPPASASFRHYPSSVCMLTKQGQRLLSSLAAAEEPSAAAGLLRKFAASSSKHVALTTLSHFLSPSNSRPHFSSLAFPLSINGLVDNLKTDEASLVMELLKSTVVDQVMECSLSELKLDLHGMHLSTTYLVLLQWFHELKLRLVAGNWATPAEVLVVCGRGKHSSARGESPLCRKCHLGIKSIFKQS